MSGMVVTYSSPSYSGGLGRIIIRGQELEAPLGNIVRLSISKTIKKQTMTAISFFPIFNSTSKLLQS